MSKFALTAELNLQIPKTKVNTSLRGLKKSLKDIGSVDVKLNTKGTAKSVRDLKKKLNEIGNVQVKFTGLKNARKFAQDVKKHLKSVDVEVNLKLPKNVQRIQNQLASQMKPIDIPISVKNAAKTSKELSKVSTTAKAISNDAKTAASGMDQFSKSMRYAFTHIAKFDLARRIFYGFVNALEQGIKDAIEFERSMIKVAQVAGTTLQNVSGLQKTVSDLSTSLGVSSNSLVKTALILKQTGLGLKDVQIAMAALAKTELAPTFDNLTNTTEAAVAAMRQFKIEASGLEPLLGKINAVAGQFAVESADIGQAIIRTGGAFKAAGGNVEELIALFTSVRATTRETAETIATGFRTIFTRLQRPKTIEFLRSFGIELTNLEGQFVGPFEAVRRLSSALQGLESTDLRFSAIVEQLGGFRQVSKVIPLIQEFSTAQAALMAQQSGANSLSKDAEKAQQSLAVQLAKVKEEFKELGREILASDGFKVLTTTAISFAKALTDIFNALSPLIPMISLLGTIKLGGLAYGAGKGLFGGKNAGGRIHRFSAGGWVRGRGNGDTVPALLEPGEFVLRKSAAQALGSSLNGINGYAKGGITKMSSAFARGNTINQNRSSRKLAGKSFKEGTHGFTAGKGGEDTVIGSLGATQRSLNTVGFHADGAPKYGLLGLLKSYAATSKNPTAQGSIFEQILAKTGIIKQGAGFGGNSPLDGTFGDGYAEVKRSKVGKNVLLDKFLRHEFKRNKLSGIGLSGGTDEINLDGKVTQINDSTNLKLLKTKLYGPNKKPARKATGGGIFGSGLSPVMLTPGEFVVNKDSARSIGYGKLGAMNKYATGGRVGRGGVKHFNTGGMMGAAGGMGAFNIAGINAMSKGAATLSKQMLETASAATFMYTAITAAGEGIKSFAGQLGIAGEGFDGLVDSISGGMAAYTAVSKAQQGFAKGLGDFFGKDSKIAKGAEARAEGGMFGAGAARKRMDLSARKDQEVEQSRKIKARFKAKSAELKERGGKASELREKAKAEQQAIKDSLQKKAGDAGVKLTKADLEQFTGERGGPLTKKQQGKMDALGEAGLGGTVAGMQKDMKNARQVQQEQLKIQRSSAGLLKKEEAIATKGLRDQAAKINGTRKELAAQQKNVKMLKMLGAAAQVAIAAVGQFGGKMKDEAMEQIKSGDISGGRGEAAVTQAGIGGALSGGAAGAQAGAVFGPWGMAIGAAVGGIYGLVNATAEAEKALRQRKFTDATSEMADAMESFSNKEIGASAALAKTIRANEAAKNTVGGEEGLKFAKQNQDQTKILVESMAKSSKSVQDFDSEISGMLPTLLKERSIRQDQIDKIREEIQARQESREKLDEAARAREEEIAKLRQVKGTVSAFDEAAYRAKRFGDALAKTASPTGAANIGTGLSGQLRADSTDSESIKRFESMIDRLSNVAGEGVGGKAGTGLGRFGQDAKDAGFIQRNISTMVLAASQGTNVTEDSFAENMKEQLKAAIGREGYAGLGEGSSQKNRLDRVMAGLDPQLMKDLNDPQKRQGAMDTIEDELKGSQQEMLDAFVEVAKLTEQHVNNLGGMYAKRNALELDYINKSNQAMQMRFDAEQEYAKNISVSRFGGPTDEEVQANFKGQQANLLDSAGLDPAMAGNVGELSNEFKQVRKRLDENTQKLQTQDVSGTGGELGAGMAKMADENAKLQKQYSALKQALEKNTNSTQRLSALQESLKREQEKQKTLEQLTFDAAYGTAEEKDTAARLINAVNTAMQAGSVTAVAPELQRQVANLLPQVAGKEGEDIRRKGLNKFLGTSGSAPTAAGGVDFQGITAVSEKQVEIANKILEVQGAAADAQEALANDVKTSADNMGSAIAEANKQFLTELKQLLIQNFERDIAQDQAVNTARAKDVTDVEDRFAKFGFNLGDNQESASRLKFLESMAKNIEFQAKSDRTAGLRSNMIRTGATGTTGSGGFNADSMLAIMDEFGDNNVGNALQAAQDDIDYSAGSFMEGAFGMDYGSQTETSMAKRNAAASMSLVLGSGQKKTRTSLGGIKHQTRDFTQADVNMLNEIENDDTDAMDEARARVQLRLGKPLDKLQGEFGATKEYEDFATAMKNLDQAGTGEQFASDLADVIKKYEKALTSFEASSKSMADRAGFQNEDERLAGKGGKRTAAQAQEIQAKLRRELVEGTAGGAGFMFGDKKVSAEDITTDGKRDEAKINELIAAYLRESVAKVPDLGEFERKRTQVKDSEKSIEDRKAEAAAIRGEQALGPAPTQEETLVASGTATGFDQSVTGSALADLSAAGLAEGSIFTHDTHCEAILERIAVALEGGGGTASNPASETTGSVAFTQTLDSSGFQDGVDKFSTTVESLREIMAGALNVEIGGTVTVDVNLKEGAAFLNDSKNAIGMMVSQKINGAINNFIKNGLKDARVNTGNWDDSEATPLANNGGY